MNLNFHLSEIQNAENQKLLSESMDIRADLSRKQDTLNNLKRDVLNKESEIRDAHVKYEDHEREKNRLLVEWKSEKAKAYPALTPLEPLMDLKKLADMLPKEEKPQKYNSYQPSQFDLDEWLDKYGLRYRKTSYSGGTKYILDACPFDSNHNGKDACIFKSSNGAIGFHCFHNSCADKTWKDVRLLYEPDAYEKKQQEYERKIYAKPKSQPERKKIEEKEGKPVFLTAKDILTMPKSPERFVKTGINDIDKRMRGLKTGYTSVISGLRASGKSSVISEICLDCVEAGNKVDVYSGELSPQNFMRWMNLQAAGKAYAEPTQFEGYYNVSRQNQEKIAEWLSNNFSLYNNEYGNDFLAIKDQLERKFERNKPDLVILDNLMAFDIKSLSDNKYEAQELWKFLDTHRSPNKALIKDNLKNVARMGFQLGNEVK